MVIAATAGNPCLLTVQGIAERRPDLEVIVPHYCDHAQAYLAPAGEAADGTLALRSTVEAFSSSLDGSAVGELAEREYASLEYRGLETAEWPLVWQTVQLLQIAAALPGGLTRSNVVLAAWSFEGRHPQMEGRAAVTWNEKPRAVTEVRLYRYSHAASEWLPTNTMVNLEP